MTWRRSRGPKHVGLNHWRRTVNGGREGREKSPVISEVMFPTHMCDFYQRVSREMKTSRPASGSRGSDPVGSWSGMKRSALPAAAVGEPRRRHDDGLFHRLFMNESRVHLFTPTRVCTALCSDDCGIIVIIKCHCYM